MPDGLLLVALGAGMLAAVNPCGFALLPAYLSLLVLGDQPPGRVRAVGRALALTGAMTVGFVAVFGVFGLVVAPVASSVQRYLPWFTVVLGLALLVVGLLLAAGRSLPAIHLRRRRGPVTPLTASFGSMAGFGASYAVASLTCTVAPFLAVVVAGFRTESWLVGASLFLAYAAGMALVVGTVAVATALASGSLVGRIRRAGAWIPRAGGVLLAVAGGYVAYYGVWELRVLAGAEASDPVIDAAARIQRWMADGVSGAGATTWLLVLAALVASAVLTSRLVRRGVNGRRRSTAGRR